MASQVRSTDAVREIAARAPSSLGVMRPAPVSPPVVSASGREVITIEGLAEGDTLHPVQVAFIEETAFQCAYCTPGFIIGAVALLSRNPRPTDDEIRSGLSGHICRCGAYTRILRAVRTAARKSMSEQEEAI